VFPLWGVLLSAAGTSVSRRPLRGGASVKQLFRVDDYGRTWIATEWSVSLVKKQLKGAFELGYALEFIDRELPSRERGAA
jgi:hypothetical protein